MNVARLRDEAILTMLFSIFCFTVYRFWYGDNFREAGFGAMVAALVFGIYRVFKKRKK